VPVSEEGFWSSGSGSGSGSGAGVGAGIDMRRYARKCDVDVYVECAVKPPTPLLLLSVASLLLPSSTCPLVAASACIVTATVFEIGFAVFVFSILN
jgi:hypothetical protein